MTVGSHIAEILRQGIWASLSGGWYYEPTYSIFCNTVHLYVWLILVLMPLALGLFFSAELTVGLIVGYAGTTLMLFTAIKLLISYFHKLFDTSDPVVVTRTVNDSIDETLRDSEQQVLDSEMIELRDMGFNMRGSTDRTLGRDRVETGRDRDSTSGISTRRTPGRSGSRSTEREHDTAASATSSRRVRIDEDSQSMSADANRFVVVKVDEEKSDHGIEIDFTRRRQRYYEEIKSDSEAPMAAEGRRKLSEPLVSPLQYEKLRLLGGDEQDLEKKGDVQQKDDDQKAESAGEEASDKKAEKQRRYNAEPAERHPLEEVETKSSESETEDEPSTSQAASVGKSGSVDAPPRRRSGRTSKRRCSTGTAKTTRSNRRTGSPAVFDGIVKQGSQTSSTGTSNAAGWAPVVVSLGDIDRPSTSRYSADEESGSDIKVELTKFLEDLIDKHPETLDAIESVRMSRLGLRSALISRPPSGVPTMSAGDAPIPYLTSERAPHGAIPAGSGRSSSRRSSSFMDWHVHHATSSTPAHHIASGHEDTSQGAVHSFQDEDGIWWTYTFDENGVGTAQPLGTGRALLDLVNRERERAVQSGSTQEPPVVKAKPWSELEVLPESMYDSTDEEKEEKDGGKAPQNSARTTVSTTRRERAMSSSSNESCTYIPTLPSSVFHAPTGTGASRGRGQMVSFSNAASRIRHALRNSNETHDGAWHVNQIMDLIESTNNRRSDLSSAFPSRTRGDSLPPFTPQTGQDRPFFHFDGGPMSGQRFLSSRFLSDLGLTAIPTGSATTPDFSTNRRQSNVRRSYYYQMKMFPKAQKSLNLKLDRPSVDRLFDRNRCIYSFVLDIVLGTSVAVLASLVLQTDVYFDMSLVLFCFVVAGAQFSLLKSVQPDAASPIHGFNWVVAYSRPVYFCIFASVLLVLNFIAGESPNERIPWNWNPYRLPMTNWSSVVVAFRDLVATLFLFHPVAFTLGWFPQVNTLTHHILEQVEMHVFGGTASFGVFSAFVQLTKSMLAYSGLVALCRYAYQTSSTSTQVPVFSGFVAAVVGVSYLLSRSSSNQQLTLIFFENLLSAVICWKSSTPNGWMGLSQRMSDTEEQTPKPAGGDSQEEPNAGAEGMSIADDLPASLRRTVSQRARFDFFFVVCLVLIVFGLHSTSVFSATQPYFTKIAIGVCVVFAVINHYVYPQLRTHTPWKAVAKPILRSAEHGPNESPNAAKLMAFEVVHVWMKAIEKNILYPLMVVSLVTECGWNVWCPWITLPLAALRILRGGFAQPQLIYMPLAFATVACVFDWRAGLPFGLDSGTSSWNFLPILAFIFIVVYPKCIELYLKISFVMAYVAPWQISWGSAFHAFAQPFSVPHSALIGIQTVASSIISAPLNPFLGSSFFTTSYVRPVKFWERDYNTKRSDASNMRLASQLDRGPMMDDSNLNAVFYEHLTRSLQKSLAGDIAMGRWATSVQPGDCFILASFYLNCLVHIVEVGNGFITFQLRGLEFRGTYCHQREVEAISEDQIGGSGCCCCSPGSLPGFLSLNTAWGLRWLAWEVVSAKYIIDGYNISDNSAVNLLQVHELRRLLVSLYVKCIIYYLLKSPRLLQWIDHEVVSAAMDPVRESSRYADLDSIFCSTNDEDFDQAETGISRASFSEIYTPWINHCLVKRAETFTEENLLSLDVTVLCFLLSLVGRRALGIASYNRHSNAAESFLYGLHALFKGDFRIMCSRDEWVFADMDLLRCVVAPAVKMALKLHQDHFAHFEEFDDAESLYNLIADHQMKMFISHEQDPAWRRAIMANTPSLLALRHMYDDGQDDYKIIMLNKMHLNMRVIKLNRECVRAFWAGQQQELIFLRNRNPERGSIQNARQVLRNMINSSADQPVGYPIYVSPLTTSLVETHSQIDHVLGPTITLEKIAHCGRGLWRSLRSHFGPSGSTSVNQGGCGPSNVTTSSAAAQPVTTSSLAGDARLSANSTPAFSDEDREVAALTQQKSSSAQNSIVEMTRDGSARVSVVTRREGSEPTTSSALVATAAAERERLMTRDKQTTVIARARELQNEREFSVGAWVQIIDVEQIFKYLNEPLKSTGEPLVVWPDERIRQISGRGSWIYQPMRGMCGRIVFTWSPNHANKNFRSHVGDHIHLVAIPAMTNGFVPVGEKGCRLLSPSESAVQAVVSTTAVRNFQEHVEFMNRVNDVFMLTGIIPAVNPVPGKNYKELKEEKAKEREKEKEKDRDREKEKEKDVKPADDEKSLDLADANVKTTEAKEDSEEETQNEKESEDVVQEEKERKEATKSGDDDVSE